MTEVLLPLLILFPLASALLAVFLNKVMALLLARGLGLCLLGVSLFLIFIVEPFSHAVSWKLPLGTFSLLFDDLSRCLIALTSLVFLFSVYCKDAEGKSKGFHSLLMLILACANGVLLSSDGLLFYCFWEGMLVPAYFLLGGLRSDKPGLLFVLYTAAGGGLMLFAFSFLAAKSFQDLGFFSFSFEDWHVISLNIKEQVMVFSLLFVAFGIKVPLLFFHGWSPVTYSRGPYPVSMLLAGAVSKLGIYGFVRLALPLSWDISAQASYVLMLFGAFGIIYGSLMAWVETDMRRFIAYSSLGHVGVSAVAIGSLQKEGIMGGLFQMLIHGIFICGFFLLAETLERKYKTGELAKIRGLAFSMPKLTRVFFLLLLSGIGLPLTGSFIGEFLSIVGVFKRNFLFASIMAFGIVFTAVYMLSLFRRLCLGEQKSIVDVDAGYPKMLFVIVVLLIVFGICPEIILDRLLHLPLKALILGLGYG